MTPLPLLSQRTKGVLQLLWPSRCLGGGVCLRSGQACLGGRSSLPGSRSSLEGERSGLPGGPGLLWVRGSRLLSLWPSPLCGRWRTVSCGSLGPRRSRWTRCTWRGPPLPTACGSCLGLQGHLGALPPRAPLAALASSPSHTLGYDAAMPTWDLAERAMFHMQQNCPNNCSTQPLSQPAQQSTPGAKPTDAGSGEAAKRRSVTSTRPSHRTSAISLHCCMRPLWGWTGTVLGWTAVELDRTGIVSGWTGTVRR